MRRALPLALALAACGGIAQPGLDIDFGGICALLEVSIVDPDLLPAVTVHAFAASDGEGGGWALVDDGTSTLKLQRLPDGPSLGTGVLVDDADAFSLLPGPALGEVWVTFGGVGAHLEIARLSADGTLEQVDRSDFPALDDVEERLIFIGREPHLLASPTRGTDDAFAFILGALSRDLAIEMVWELSFTPECYGDGSSPCLPATYPRLHVLDQAEADGASPALLLLEFERTFAGIDTRTTGVATLQLARNAGDGLPSAVKREYVDLLWGHSMSSLRIDPGQIARDEAGYYVIAGVVVDGPTPDELAPDDVLQDRLLRHDILDATSAMIARLPKYTNSHLLQLTGQVALGQAFDGNWFAARLIGYAIDFDNVSGASIRDGASITRVGRGHVLFDVASEPALGQIACAE